MRPRIDVTDNVGVYSTGEAGDASHKYYDIAECVAGIELVDIGDNPRLFFEGTDGKYVMSPLNCRISSVHLFTPQDGIDRPARITREDFDGGIQVTRHDGLTTLVTFLYRAPVSQRFRSL